MIRQTSHDSIISILHAEFPFILPYNKINSLQRFPHKRLCLGFKKKGLYLFPNQAIKELLVSGEKG